MRGRSKDLDGVVMRRRHGVKQFVALYNRLKERRGDVLLWGDEVEYNVLKLDRRGGTVRVSLRAGELLAKLQEAENAGRGDLPSLWRPEYAAYMVEGTPGVPYGGLIDDFSLVEKNMRQRRAEVQSLLAEDEIIVSMSIFPRFAPRCKSPLKLSRLSYGKCRLGCNPFTFPAASPEPKTSFTRSLFWPSEATFQVPNHGPSLPMQRMENGRDDVAFFSRGTPGSRP